MHWRQAKRPRNRQPSCLQVQGSIGDPQVELLDRSLERPSRAAIAETQRRVLERDLTDGDVERGRTRRGARIGPVRPRRWLGAPRIGRRQQLQVESAVTVFDYIQIQPGGCYARDL